MSLSELNGEKPFIFLYYQISKVKKHLMYQLVISITERLVVRIWLIPQVSLRYIALLRTTFYKVFPFFSKVRSTQYSVAREQYDTSNPTFHDI